MITNFNEQLFIETKDTNIAIFIENLASWIKFNATKDKPEDKNYFEGRYWSFNSYPQFAKYFGGWSVKVMRSIIAKCVKLDLIKIGHFNKKRYDNTNWYTLTDKALQYYPVLLGMFLNTPALSDRTPAQMGRPIPEDNTHLRSINTTISENDKNQVTVKQEIVRQIVETYHEELPELPEVRKVDATLKAQLYKMVKDWPSYQKEGQEFTIESFRAYLNVLKVHYSWFLKPYQTESGNTINCSLRKLTREINITKIVNGEFSAK